MHVYKNKIDEESQKNTKYTQEISMLESSIESLDKKIEKKKRNLYDVMDDISLYTLEPK